MSESISLHESKQASQHTAKQTLSMTVLMTPDMSNFSGNVHGGTILKFLDQVAYACASRYAQTYVVTLSVDRVVFREPVHVGTRHVQRFRQLHRAHVDGDRNTSRNRRHSSRKISTYQQLLLHDGGNGQRRKTS